MEYDYLIVGAGIAGLHCALRISQKFPKAKIAITEMYDYTGGRILTYKKKWEAGAGRIHGSHAMILRYLKEYGLTALPIPKDTQWISEGSKVPEKDIWPSISHVIESALKKVDPKFLATHSIEEILHGNSFLQRFPYTSELSTLRADLALTLEFGSNENFYTVKEGFSEVIHNMKDTLLSRGVVFLYNHRLISIKPEESLYFEVTDRKHAYVTLYAKRAILAIHSDALKRVSPFKNLPILKHITMKPLLRTYGVFRNPWFEGMPRTITDSPLRHIIPIDERTIMTSYTDADDTIRLKKIYDKGGDDALSQYIVTELRELFPDRDIETPIFFKSHYWKYGCSYWLPGLYDPKEESDAIMSPFPNVFVCGESYSLKQAWVEGALEHAEQMLQKHILR